MRGRIIRGIAGFYYVLTKENELYACKARGIFRNTGVKPLVGDEVEFSVTDKKDMEGNVEVVLPRKNQLLRPAVSNVDQALVIFAVQKPKPSLMLIDRLLLQMKSRDLPVLLCFNKTDLNDREGEAALKAYTALLEDKILFISGKTGAGIDSLLELLQGKTTVLAGPSGVGKSTLINRIQPEAQMETGAVSEKLKRGKHTTRHAELIAAGEDTFLVDTPGFSSLILPEIPKEELKAYYPEFAPYEELCRFSGCSHTKERDCGVRTAVEEKKIPEERYRNYVTLYQELSERKAWE